MFSKFIYFLSYFTALSLILSSSINTYAHVVIKPDQVPVSTYQTFSVGVPNEKDTLTTSIKLIIPEELESVTPNVKPGWEIEIRKLPNSERVQEITWSKGTIPMGQRDDFVFTAKTPSKDLELKWKVYQTYQDGVVSWNMESQDKDAAQTPGTGPYSITKVINDLNDDKENGTELISYSSLGLAILSLIISLLVVSKPKLKN